MRSANVSRTIRKLSWATSALRFAIETAHPKRRTCEDLSNFNEIIGQVPGEDLYTACRRLLLNAWLDLATNDEDEALAQSAIVFSVQHTPSEFDLLTLCRSHKLNTDRENPELISVIQQSLSHLDMSQPDRPWILENNADSPSPRS